MCGFTFIYSKTSAAPRPEALTVKALFRMGHRGPDDSGMVSGEDWSAGQQRLSIIDVADSHQPMRDPGGIRTLVYNGEVYYG